MPSFFLSLSFFVCLIIMYYQSKSEALEKVSRQTQVTLGCCLHVTHILKWMLSINLQTMICKGINFEGFTEKKKHFLSIQVSTNSSVSFIEYTLS